MNTVEKLNKFANKHSLLLKNKGECGFGRPCVGFLDSRGNYVDYNPTSCKDFSYIFGEYNESLDAPEGVNSYHKSDCMAVLVENDNYDEGLKQLLLWVEHLESQGDVEVKEYKTGAEGMQAMFSGITGFALTINKKQ